MSGDITVQLAGGTYRESQALAMTAQDSGTGGHNVIWSAAAGATPVISGGQQLTGWSLTDASKNVWTAPVNSGFNARQLYVNGVRADRTSGALPATLTITSTGYTMSNSVMSTWKNPSDLEFVYTGGDKYWSRAHQGADNWDEPRCPVASISGTTITMAQPCWDNTTNRGTIPAGQPGAGRPYSLVGSSVAGAPTSVENAYELLNQPGQWYLDTQANTISYIPRPGQNMATADAEVPALQTLVSGAGTAGAPVSNITFSGIRFEYATWLTPSTGEGYSDLQAGYTLTGTGAGTTQGVCGVASGGTCPYGDWTKMPGAVSFQYDHGIQFLNDAFVHLGAAGLDLGDGSQNSTVQGSVFTDISGNGLELGGVDNPQPTNAIDYTSGNTIANNHLYDLPVEYHDGVPIDVGYSKGTTITHNQIDHTPYSGISIGWGGWLDKIAQAPETNYSSNNVISDNLIYDVMYLLGDGAPIYSNGTTGTSFADGERMVGNVVHDTVNQAEAYYTDNGSIWITVTGNASYNTWRDIASSHFDYEPGAPSGSYDPTLVRSNFWLEGNDFSKVFTSEANRIITGPADIPSATLKNAGLQSSYAGILNQTFAAATAPEAPTTLAAFGANGSAYVSWNPVFTEHDSPVTSYTVTASPGGAQTTISAADYNRLGYAVITGLTNGTAYTFTATASNAVGTGPNSLPSATVKPAAGSGALPAAPTGVSAIVDSADGRIAVTWTPPTTTGDTPIIGYQVSAPGLPTQTITGRAVNDKLAPHAIFANVAPGKYVFTVAALNATGTGTGANSGTATLTTPTLAGIYSNVGTSPDTNTPLADIDGSGYSLSASALAAAGVNPGSTVTAGGQSFTWPNVAAGAMDNAVASGQTITVPGSGSTLGFLATSTSVATTGTGTITYADGTTQTYTLNVPDWYQPAPTGSTVAISSGHRNTPTGPSASHTISIYYVGIPLQTGKTVATVTLPNINAAPDRSIPTLHIFAATIS